MRARLKLAILTGCCLLGTSGLLAQDASSDAGASEAEASGTEASEAKAPRTEASATGTRAGQSGTGGADSESEASPDVFIPTEEISEDFAVAFPVDI